jgi:acyl-CoA synthetase (AMP-forming)/AMP-acid ligase II
VERAILEHEAVSEVVVLGVPDEEWGEAVKAVCALKPGRSVEPQELIEFVGARIARYKKPKHVVFVDAVPRTGKGDVDRETARREHGGRG